MSGDAFDRKVRPIYDALDNRAHKSALKLANAALERYKDNDLLLALKAIALERQGRAPEAAQLCDRLLGQPRVDEEAWHPLKIVLKDLQRPHDITRMYEAALSQAPGDPTIMQALFTCYARERQYLKQQQLAMRLSKTAPGVQLFQWWTILAIVLQVRQALLPPPLGLPPSAPASLPPASLLQLAVSMAGRASGKEGRLDSFECLLLWLDLLLAQGKQEEALALVQGPMAQALQGCQPEELQALQGCQPEELQALQIDLLAATGQLPQAAALLAQRLTSNPDDWLALQAWLDCLLPGTGEGGQGAVGRCSSLLWFTGGVAALSRAMQPAAAAAAAADKAGGGNAVREGDRAGKAATVEAGYGSGSVDSSRVAPAPGHSLCLESDHQAATWGSQAGQATVGEGAWQQAEQFVAQLGEAVGQLKRPGGPGLVAGAPGQSRLTMRGPHLAKVELALRRVRACSASHPPAPPPAALPTGTQASPAPPAGLPDPPDPPAQPCNGQAATQAGPAPAVGPEEAARGSGGKHLAAAAAAAEEEEEVEEVEEVEEEEGLTAQQGLASAVWQYWQEAGHLPSCSLDLRPALAALSPAWCARLGQQLQAWLEQQPHAPPTPPRSGQAAGEGREGGPGTEKRKGIGAAAAAAAAEAGGACEPGSSGRLTNRPTACPGAAGAAGAGGGQLEGACLQRCVSALQLQSWLQWPRLDSAQLALGRAQYLMAWFAAAQPAYKGVDPRERGPADELPALACAALVQAARLAPSPAAAAVLLARCSLLLEACVSCRPHSSTMRLALAALHSALGCGAGCLRHLQALSLKHIQLDSVAGQHLVPALVAGAGGRREGGRELEGALHEGLALFRDHDRDAGDTLSSAYQHATYTKVLEFMAFSDRLHHSHTRSLMRCEMLMGQLRTATSTAITSSSSSSSTSSSSIKTTSSSSSSSSSHRAGRRELASALSSLLADQLGALLPARDRTLLARLRFNEDLSTRPPWLQPAAGDAYAQAACWWLAQGQDPFPQSSQHTPYQQQQQEEEEQQQQQQGRAKQQGSVQGQAPYKGCGGTGRCLNPVAQCWWLVPGAAESGHPAALAWRDGQAAALRLRWTLPHCLHASLTACRPPAQPPAPTTTQPTPSPGQTSSANGTTGQQAGPDQLPRTEVVQALALALGGAGGSCPEAAVDAWLAQQTARLLPAMTHDTTWAAGGATTPQHACLPSPAPAAEGRPEACKHQPGQPQGEGEGEGEGEGQAVGSGEGEGEGTRVAGWSSRFRCLGQAVQALGVAGVAAALAGAASHQAEGPDSTQAAQRCTARVAVAERLLRWVAGELAWWFGSCVQQGPGGGRVLPGILLSTAAQLVHETAAWYVACLQVLVSDGDPPGTLDPGPLHAALRSAESALRKLADSLHTAANYTDVQPSSSEPGAQQCAVLDASSTALWSWQGPGGTFDPAKHLAAIRAEQHESVTRFSVSCAALAQCLSNMV